MGRELDLLAKYPKGKRDTTGRAREKTAEDVAIARQFGREFFDGDRRHGYGGYTYSAARWQGVVADIVAEYGPVRSVLDVGCAKGHMLHEMTRAIPNLRAVGLDISAYAVGAREHNVQLHVGNARDLSRFKDKEFDLVVSINTIHNLGRHGCIHALEEIERVGKRAYVTVDTFRNPAEAKRMHDWNLTALTILSTDDWKKLFKEAGYTGDYGWWVP